MGNIEEISNCHLIHRIGTLCRHWSQAAIVVLTLAWPNCPAVGSQIFFWSNVIKQGSWGMRRGEIEEVRSYLLELLNCTLVDTTALVDQVTWTMWATWIVIIGLSKVYIPVVVDLPESTWPITTTLIWVFSLLIKSIEVSAGARDIREDRGGRCDQRVMLTPCWHCFLRICGKFWKSAWVCFQQVLQLMWRGLTAISSRKLGVMVETYMRDRERKCIEEGHPHGFISCFRLVGSR